MGLSGELINAATAVSHETIHRLSPDEVARYGIDSKTFQETRWMISEVSGQRPSVLKYITEGKGSGVPEYRSSMLRLTCAGPRTLRVDYGGVLRRSRSGGRRLWLWFPAIGAMD